jgi:multiple sugar transport system ATP-binding protein
VADIAVRGVTKSYDGTTAAVDAVDLDVADGELLVLVGPSGCGKSTLLRMIAGLEEVTAGTIAIGGRDVTHAQPKDRDIAMVFQSYALYPHMSVARNIGYPLKLARVPRDEITRRVAEVAETLQLTAVLGRRPSQLSGGQRQRVAMGRAIIRHPRAFLMDEPLSNLDAKLRVEMRAEIARLQRELAVTTVYVTHDQTEAMTMGTRVAVLRDGRIQQVDSPQRLYDRPVNLFVAGFIGSPAMNLLAATVEAGDGGAVAVRIGPHRLALDSGLVAAHPGLAARAGGPVTVGIRPEAFADVAVEPGAPPDRVIEAPVDLVESLGAELVVHVTVTDAPGRAIARLGTHSHLAAGDTVRLAVDTARVHLFDAGTGESLRADPPPVRAGATGADPDTEVVRA